MTLYSTFFNYLYKNSKYFFYVWLLIILIISSLPQIPILRIKSTKLNVNIRLDYLVHFWEFFILAVFFVLWRLNKNSQQALHLWISYISIGLGLSLVVEIYQNLIPGRTFNIIDSLFNCLGFTAGILLIYILLKTKNPNTKNI